MTGHNVSSRSIYLQWSAIPSELVAGVLREYRIVYDELNDRNEPIKTHVLRLPIDQLSVNLTNLEKYTKYSFELQGISKFFGVNSPPIVTITDQDGKNRSKSQSLQTLNSVFKLMQSFLALPLFSHFVGKNLCGEHGCVTPPPPPPNNGSIGPVTLTARTAAISHA